MTDSDLIRRRPAGAADGRQRDSQSCARRRERAAEAEREGCLHEERNHMIMACDGSWVPSSQFPPQPLDFWTRDVICDGSWVPSSDLIMDEEVRKATRRSGLPIVASRTGRIIDPSFLRPFGSLGVQIVAS
ncbi:hypothetical protein AXG93_2767s1060 [Marchantia polymorpha subsp. ruderalis]|uniref:Uncharacterized protein n=1 Tax=Marchantia polymorpha subsp. ruderalis TaxID=1480154 RepID=A0A176VV20_MARPO|nr:hypothetical protein AXG93_2767s1060 [Marchantia polymorpha subsp. ruderalis]